MRAISLQQEQSNFRHLVLDIAWFGLAFAATSRFLQFYAIRLGATPMELGWLTALPAIILFFSTGFSVWWRRRYSNSLNAILLPSIGFRLIFLLPVLAPAFPQEWRTTWIILAATLPALPQGVASSVFIVLMRESVSREALTPLVTRRAVALNVTVTVGAIVFGLLLEWLPFPLNYQVMFMAAFIFSLMSLWHVTRLDLRTADGRARPPAPQKPLLERLRSPYFQSVMFVTLISHIAFFTVFAVTPIRLEQDLGATEGFMAAFGVAELLAGALVASFIDKVVARAGNRAIVAWGLAGTALAAAWIALAPALWLTLGAAALTGASWTAVGIGTLGFFAERTESDDMQSTVLFHQMIFFSMFIGPLLGSSLADMGISVVVVMLLGAGLRAVSAVLVHHGISVFSGQKVRPLAK